MNTAVGTLILSFDCEGKWGVADHLSDEHQKFFTDQALQDAYRLIVELLRTHQIPATFAFTTAFALTYEDYQSLAPDLANLRQMIPNWMRPVDQKIQQGHPDGWFGKACLDLVRTDARHEIGSHGFSHVPWTESYITGEVLAQELQLLRKAEKLLGLHSKTFIYPRNQIAHLDLLTQFGFAGYRGTKEFKGRAFNLLNELNIFSPSDPHSTPDLLLKIPSGYFLNWRSGLRKKIPISVTVKRWRHLIQDAIRKGQVAHLWCHPENFINGEGMYALLDQILEIAADEVKKGHLQVLTQAAYIDALSRCER